MAAWRLSWEALALNLSADRSCIVQLVKPGEEGLGDTILELCFANCSVPGCTYIAWCAGG